MIITMFAIVDSRLMIIKWPFTHYRRKQSVIKTKVQTTRDSTEANNRQSSRDVGCFCFGCCCVANDLSVVVVRAAGALLCKACCSPTAGLCPLFHFIFTLRLFFQIIINFIFVVVVAVIILCCCCCCLRWKSVNKRLFTFERNYCAHWTNESRFCFECNKRNISISISDFPFQMKIENFYIYSLWFFYNLTALFSNWNICKKIDFIFNYNFTNYTIFYFYWIFNYFVKYFDYFLDEFSFAFFSLLFNCLLALSLLSLSNSTLWRRRTLAQFVYVSKALNHLTQIVGECFTRQRDSSLHWVELQF